MRETVRYLFDAPNWVSWITHSVLMLVIAGIVTVVLLLLASVARRPLTRVTALQVGLVAAATSYVVAEVRHVIWKWVTATPIDGAGWVDHVMDAAMPTFAALGLVWFLGRRKTNALAKVARASSLPEPPATG